MRSLTLIAIAWMSFSFAHAQDEATPQRVVSNVLQLNENVDNLQRQISSGALRGEELDKALRELGSKVMLTNMDIDLLKAQLTYMSKLNEKDMQIAREMFHLQLERMIRISEERQRDAHDKLRKDGREDASMIANIAALKARLAAKDELRQQVQESEDRSERRLEKRSDEAAELATLRAALLVEKQNTEIHNLRAEVEQLKAQLTRPPPKPTIRPRYSTLNGVPLPPGEEEDEPNSRELAGIVRLFYLHNNEMREFNNGTVQPSYKHANELDLRLYELKEWSVYITAQGFLVPKLAERVRTAQGHRATRP